MLRIKPFSALRPTPALVAEVACVPYDVVNRDESAALAANHPLSLLHVDRAEIDLPADIDPYSDPVYHKALENFLALQSNGTLIRESQPSIYLYQQRIGHHLQTGIATLCHIDDYENEVIKKHEKTRPDKENDRTRLINTLSADTGPVFLTYRESPPINALVDSALQSTTPLYDFTAPDGIQHSVWQIPGGEDFVELFRQIPLAYVADGHHRTASACRVGRERRAANPAHDGSEDYNWFLAVLFPASQLQILPYNRVVHSLNGHSKESFLHAVSLAFTLQPSTEPSPSTSGQIHMYLDHSWFSLSWTPSPDADPISQLDVSALQDRVLAPLLGITDPRTSKNIDFIGGIRGPAELTKIVDSGLAAVAFSLFPTTVDQLIAIADANQIMPPKSTWFEPKLRSGLFIHTF
ncbi:MAG: DUF1015 family protein [Verrucomicrobia bacterium]|nr:DUF1015 family protein [Verrucomicrobiota bacterium]